jgi:hypothetical protein
VTSLFAVDQGTAKRRMNRSATFRPIHSPEADCRKVEQVGCDGVAYATLPLSGFDEGTPLAGVHLYIHDSRSVVMLRGWTKIRNAR